ncbi:MAG: aminotransferase class V-fold PLP-dependent enzyme [Thiolinea sp.]
MPRPQPVCSDAETLTWLAHDHDCLVIVDAVTSLAGSPLKVDEWNIDAIYSGTQKCLSCIPGISPVSFSARAVDVIKNRKTPVQSWFLDMNLIMGYWGGGAKRAYHHTAPVNSLYAFHESLVMVREEGLENARARHQHHHQALKAGLEAMGIRFIVDEAHRLPQLNLVGVPEGVDEAAVRNRLLNDYDLEIGSGLGALAGKVWRIGLMGHASNRKNVLLCLNALENVLSEMKAPIEQGVAVAAAQAVFNA